MPDELAFQIIQIAVESQFDKVRPIKTVVSAYDLYIFDILGYT